MRTLALELVPEGIRVNCLFPGITDTPQPRVLTSEAEFYANAKIVPLGRPGRAEEMAEEIRFLLEHDSSSVTGQDIRINSGLQIS